jgi:hypothetical protein
VAQQEEHLWVSEMTQVGEPLTIGMVKSIENECPFHEEHDCPSPAKNQYTEGNASKLGVNLHDGGADSSTVQRSDVGYRSPKAAGDPDEIPEEEREVSIKKGVEACRYPVVYSAHHLIPAKESMKRAKKLHKFIDKRKGEICCNLGYDVDGNENGVWLPALHGVNGIGLDIWGSASMTILKFEKIGVKSISIRELGGGKNRYDYSPLSGVTPSAGSAAFHPNNMKWMYVQEAMRLRIVGTRQFHDRHVNYSAKVKGHLNALATVLEILLGLAKDPAKAPCKKCAKSGEKAVPPPFAMLGLLNKLSSRLCARLVGRTQDDEYYTSSWCGPDAPKTLPARRSS